MNTTLHSTYFAFNAIGASIASIIAQIVMEDLEETVLSEIGFEIPFFFRYEDDCVTAVPNDKTDQILAVFNKYNKSLQFACKLYFPFQLEDKNSLNFFDITLHR